MRETLRPVLFAFFTLLWCSSLAAAQKDLAISLDKLDSGAQHQTLLTRISLLLNSSEQTTGNFEQRKFITVLPKPLISTGQFKLDDNSELEWLILKPVRSRLVFDHNGIHQNQHGKTVWQASNEQPGVTAIGLILRSILSADLQPLTAYFGVEGTLENQVWRLVLTPNEPFLQQVVTKITLTGSSHINTVNLFEVGGDRTEIRFEIL